MKYSGWTVLRLIILIGTVASLPGVSSCNREPTAASQDLLAAASAETGEELVVPAEGWVVYSNDRFSFQGPPGLRIIPVQGIDSFVGILESAEVHIEFDYGMYSDDSFDGRVGATSSSTFNIEEVSVDGKDARLAFFDDNKYPETYSFVYAVYIADILGVGKGEPGETKLYLKVCFKDSSFKAMARRILLSLRFAD